MDEPRTIHALRELGVELILTPDKSGVRVRRESHATLTPELRAAIARQEDTFLRVLLFREAASFVSRRLKEAGLSWHDAAYDEAVAAFDGGDHHERLNEAWSASDPESVKEVLRLCARSSVRVLGGSPPEVPPSDGRAGNQNDGASWPEPRRSSVAYPPETSREARNDDETNPQLPLDAT